MSDEDNWEICGTELAGETEGLEHGSGEDTDEAVSRARKEGIEDGTGLLWSARTQELANGTVA